MHVVFMRAFVVIVEVFGRPFGKQALLNIISNPVNSTVPIAAETLKKMGAYDPKRLFGVTTLDVVCVHIRSCLPPFRRPVVKKPCDLTYPWVSITCTCCLRQFYSLVGPRRCGVCGALGKAPLRGFRSLIVGRRYCVIGHCFCRVPNAEVCVNRWSSKSCNQQVCLDVYTRCSPAKVLNVTGSSQDVLGRKDRKGCGRRGCACCWRPRRRHHPASVLTGRCCVYLGFCKSRLSSCSISSRLVLRGSIERGGMYRGFV